MADPKGEGLKVGFDGSLRLEFHGAKVTSDAGLLAYRDLDEALVLFDSVPSVFRDSRTGRNIQHDLASLLRQSVYSRLAGYEDVNDAHRLSVDPTMRRITGKKMDKKKAASANTMGRFETEMLSVQGNLKALSEVNGRWVERALEKTTHRRIILDMDSSASPVHGEQEASAYNGHFRCTCYHPLFCFNQFGDCEGAMLRPGNVHSADGWKEMLEPIVARYEKKTVRKYFRGDAAFAKPDVYEYLEEKGFLYAIRLPANEVLQAETRHLLTRPVGRPPRKPIVWFADFQYQAASWDRPRRVIAKVEWHRGELFPRVGFIVTNMSAQASGVVHFYNGRGTAEQWIKEGKYALHWTRLSCQRFVPNQVRLALFVLAYNLGNFLRRLVLPRKIKHWSLRSLLTKLIKIGAKVIRHSRIVTFQMAEVAISKDIWDNHAVGTLCRDCSYQPPRDAETCPACGSARIVRHKELHGLTLAHLDCDAFYAAIEKRDRPELRDVPVVVGGHHRGVVAACCYIARAQGVYSAMPMFKALKACPEATVIKPDMKKYAAVGREVRAMMRNLTPLVEPLSIDEAFMDLAGTEALHRGSPATTLATLARRVEEELSITVSIGLSYNKFLAKIASDLDKPRGFAVIGRAEAKTFLSDKPVSLLWGAGKAMRQRLDKDGITRIGDLVRIDEAELVARYGKIGRRLSLCARGEDDRRVDPEGKARSLSSETTLDKDTAELARLRPILWQLAETVARRMKKAGIAGKGVTLKLKTSTFRIVTRSRRLKSATQSAEELFQTAEPLLVHEADGRAFRLIGIGAHDLVEAGQVAQGDLFGGIGSTESKVEKALDAVREKFGDDAIVKGRGFGTKLERQGPSKVE